MTEFIAHRINKISDLKNLPSNFGVEIDLRDHQGKIVIGHDPFDYSESDCFEEYLQNYQHQTLILNIKSERIESEVLRIIKKYQIKKYFF